jgi:hypothetical protein
MEDRWVDDNNHIYPFSTSPTSSGRKERQDKQEATTKVAEISKHHKEVRSF